MLGKCSECGKPAVSMRRPAIHDGYEEKDGKKFAKFRPGEPALYCEAHKPKEEEPVETADSNRPR